MPESAKYSMTAVGQDTMIAIRLMQDRGRIQIPRVIRDALQLKDGDNVLWIKTIDGKFSIVKTGKV